MSMESITGGCGCGAVRYRAKGPIGFHILCQCRFCQRFSGSVHSALLAVPKEGLIIEFELTNVENDPEAAEE